MLQMNQQVAQMALKMAQNVLLRNYLKIGANANSWMLAIFEILVWLIFRHNDNFCQLKILGKNWINNMDGFLKYGTLLELYTKGDLAICRVFFISNSVARHLSLRKGKNITR